MLASFQLGLHHAVDGLSATCGQGCQDELFKTNFRNLTLSQVDWPCKIRLDLLAFFNRGTETAFMILVVKYRSE